jgi:hypothetical protein
MKIKLGGQGGQAPGAGGGAGGAVDPDAVSAGAEINLNGTPGMAPGAGGGGAGAIGRGAVGGGGGEGGEYVIATFGPGEIGPNSEISHLRFQIGAGGRDGGPGGDTIVNFCDKDGNVLRTLIAKGGKMGVPGYVPLQSRAATAEDIKAGLKVTGILAADYIRQKNGLLTVLDGGWDFYTANANPFQMILPLLIEIETGTIAPETILELTIRVKNPGGFQVLEKPQLFEVLNATELVRRSRCIVTLEFTGSQAGLWRVQVLADAQVIGEFPIEVRLRAATTTEAQ